MNEEDYKQTMMEQQWVEQEFADDVLDAVDDVLDGMTFKAPEKKKVQEWTLITRKEFLAWFRCSGSRLVSQTYYQRNVGNSCCIG